MESNMPELLLSAVEYGGYINPIKLGVFVVLFFGWLLLVKWVYEDAGAVGTDDSFWTGIVVAAGAAGALIWLLVPVFIIGLIFYIAAVGAGAISYIMHRDSLAMEHDRILSMENIKGLFANEGKKLKEIEGILFITANNNEVPTPEPKTPEFYGYKAATDLFTDATRRRAENVIFSPTAENYDVTYNIDGAPLKQPSLARGQIDHLSKFMKSLADLDVEERRKPQKGKFTVRLNKNNTDWEITTAGSTEGEQVRLKQLTKQSLTRLDDLGLTEKQFELMDGMKEVEQGLFIVSGPKKSGVTTTMYSLLREHDAFINSITTLEKQPAAKLLNIPQEIYSLSDTGVTTYGKKLLSIVRREPDIVGVAECPDSETAQIACKTAMGGKVIYLILEADSAAKALVKWIKLIGERKAAIESLVGISNQRILRMLCEECKQAYEPNKELLRKFNLSSDKAKVFHRAGKMIYSKHGKGTPCDHCQETGYVGRMGIFEVVKIDDDLKSTLRQAKSVSDVEMQFRSAGMRSLQEQALSKVIEGVTAINEMVRVFSASKKEKPRPAKQRKL